MSVFTIDLLTGNIFLLTSEVTGDTPTSGSTYSEVNLYTDLPAPAGVSGEIYVVRTGSGSYVSNRKDAGLYFSTGTVWNRLGDTPAFFNSNNFQVYDGVDTSKGIDFDVSGITTGTFRTVKVQDADGTIAYLTDLDSKVDVSVFNTYTGATDVRLINIENNITTLSGRTDYNINYNTQANILAMNPSDHLNEKWWATDTMIEYDAKSVAITGNNHWIELGLQYDSDLDGYKLPTNLSGQTQDIGKEIIVDAYNNNTTGATTLNPSVFLSVGSHLTINKIGNYVMATAGDISTGSVYGINTTDAQPDDYFKLTTYGYVTGVNTSDYSVNTVLYVSPTVEGGITDIKPDINAFLIGIVTKQHATEGIIFVNTIRATSDISSTITASQSTVWFTGDQTSGLTGGTFYIATPYGVGSVSGATITATVPDNSIVAGSQDLLGPSGTTELTYRSGLYEAQLDINVDSAANNERIYMEIYHANHDGTVIDSGISGTSVGDLGVRPVIYMESSLLSMAAGIDVHVSLEGIILESHTQPQGDRFRMHILFEKVGAVGGDLNFTTNVGYEYQSWIKIPALIFLNDLVDVSTTGAATGNVIKRNASGIWVASSVEINEINGLQTELDNKLNVDVFTGYTATTTLQQQYENSEIPQISTTTALGALTIKRGSTADSDSVFDIENGSDIVTSSIKGDGTAIHQTLVLPKTTGSGIKVDTTTPTFGWNDLIGVINTRTGGAGVPSYLQYIGGIYQWSFGTVGGVKEVFNEYHIRHDFVPNTNMYIHTHWSTILAPTGDVNWIFEVTYAKGYDQMAFQSPVTIPVVQTSTTAYNHMIAEVQMSAPNGLISSAINVLITSGLNTLTSASSLFTAADINRTIRIIGAGVAGADLDTTITAFGSSTSVTVADNASTTITSQPNFNYRVIDSNQLEIDGLLLVRTWRNSTREADTLDVAPFLHFVDIHYQSTNLTTKDKNYPFYT